MIVPSSRLLWLAAMAALPAATAAGLAPQLAGAGTALLAACATLAAADAVLASRRAAQLRVGTAAWQRLTKDTVFRLPLTVENRSSTPISLRLSLAMPEGVRCVQEVQTINSVPGAAQIEWPCTGVRRGDHELRQAHLETSSPLGLWQAQRAQKVACSLRVYPNLRDRATASLFRRTEEAGLRKRPQVGKGREFENLRHYLPGDSFEDVHWKATARRGFPVVKLYQVEHAQEVYAVVDSSRLSAREGALESCVNACLHLALVAERQGDRFGLITFSDRPHRFVRAGRGLGHFRLCREAIYGLQPERVNPDFREVFSSLQVNLRRRALLVFFTHLDDALLAETFEREVGLVARRHIVRVQCVRPSHLKPLFAGPEPADLDAIYQGLAGQMLWNRMRELQLALHNQGVRLSFSDPDRIKTQVTSDYMEVKRRQLL
jgi:uncharacterized protein (DUF58 family)